MNKKYKIFLREFETTSLIFLSIFLLVAALTITEISFIYSEDRSSKIELKRKVTSLIQLPDIAVVTEATWLRHRTISNVFTVFPEDGSLLDYYPASFVYKVDFPNKGNLSD